IADSRPEPEPWTRTCTRRTPSDIASRAACSAATVAANGVDFLDPLKPALPDEPHDTAFPWVSVMVIVVLLNVALMWATPSASMTRLLFFAVAIGLLGDLLLAGDRAAWALLRTGVRVRALTANRQTAAMADSSIGTDIHQTLDVHGDFGAQRTLDAVVALDRLSQPIHVGIVEIPNAEVSTHTSRLQNLPRGGAADAEDVRETDLDRFIAREIDASNSSHILPLPLLMLGVSLTDDPRDAAALYHSAVLTDRLNAAANFHRALHSKLRKFRPRHSD